MSPVGPFQISYVYVFDSVAITHYPKKKLKKIMFKIRKLKNQIFDLREETSTPL